MPFAHTVQDFRMILRRSTDYF